MPPKLGQTHSMHVRSSIIICDTYATISLFCGTGFPPPNFDQPSSCGDCQQHSVQLHYIFGVLSQSNISQLLSRQIRYHGRLLILLRGLLLLIGVPNLLALRSIPLTLALTLVIYQTATLILEDFGAMNVREYDGTLNASQQLLDSSRRNAITVWREHLKAQVHNSVDDAPALIWEIVANERMNSRETFPSEGDQDDISTVTYPNVTSESYERYFPRVIGNGTTTSSSFHLRITEDDRLNMVGIQPKPIIALPERIGSGSGVIDPYTRERVSVDQMSMAKIQRDMHFMWTRRLYADVHIVIPTSSSTPYELDQSPVAAFSCHRWILIERSPYLLEILGAVKKTDINGMVIIPLPSPPFIPITLNFVLRFLYTASLHFPSQDFDWQATEISSHVFSIYRAALFLRIPSLKEMIAAHIISDMTHGLFSASLDSDAFHQLTGGFWKNMRSSGEGKDDRGGGCQCDQCLRRIPRVLSFAVEPGVQDKILERGARRALVGLFGPGWCTMEFGLLSETLLESVLEDLGKVITTHNALALLFASQEAFETLGSAQSHWVSHIREIIGTARMKIAKLLCRQSRPCFYCNEWKDIVTHHGQTSGWEMHKIHEKRLRWIFESISMEILPENAGDLYQTLTWFTDALVPPAKQNKAFSKMIGVFSEEMHKLMMKGRPASYVSFAPSTIEAIDPLHNALDLSSISDLTSGTSIYSHPSSRTMSTDYGIYYRRMALSQETISDRVFF